MDELPEYIYPAQLAEQGRRLRGLMRLTNMTRLAECIESCDGSVAVEAAFFDTEKGLHRVRGEVSGTLTVRCQRCMEQMELPVRSGLKLQFVEEASQIEPDAEYEMVRMTRGPTSFLEVIEDELILALPIAPTHPDGRCGATVATHASKSPLAEASDFCTRINLHTNGN
ncbi:MAG: YceD family protein [Gammaproteobacteria bacterium]